MHNFQTAAPERPGPRFIEALLGSQAVLGAYLHARVANRADASDILQETNLKLWQKANSWSPDTPFLPWAFAVARFTLLSHFRDRGRDRLVFDPDVVEAMEDECKSAALEVPVRQEALGQCLGNLSESQRILLREHYYAGRPLRELAHRFGKTEASIKMTLFRLRQRLSTCISVRLRSGAP